MKTIFARKLLIAAFFSVLAFSLLASCGGSSGDSGTDQSYDGVALGHGTDIFGKYASEDNIKGLVLDLDRLDDYDMLSVDHNVEEATFIYTSGTNISEYASNIGVTVGIEGRYKYFSGSIETSFLGQHLKSEEYSFSTVKELIKKSSLKVLDFYRFGDVLTDYLTPQAAEALETWTPEQIVQAYGTHVMVGIYEGARLDYNMSIKVVQESYKENIEAYATASYKTLFASAEVTTGLTTEEMESFRSYSQNSTVDAKGGFSQFASCNSDNPAVCEQSRLTWLNSINENPVFCAIMKGGLIPIWELVTDPDKREAIQTYFKSYAIGKNLFYPRYDEDGLTVTDNYEGLMWAKKLSGNDQDAMHDPTTEMNWEMAEYWLETSVNHNRHAGYNDWRLPNYDELWTLVDHNLAPAPLVDPRFGVINRFYWSINESVNPYTGLHVLLSKDDDDLRHPVILVRDAF